MSKSDSARKPKLPKLWVEFKNGVAWGTYYKKPAEQFRGKNEYHQYAPVQPPKRCVWEARPGATLGDHKTKCGWWMTRDERFGFCPNCGGRIVRRKS